MFGRRSDATLVRDLPKMRRFMPFISPRRNDALVYFDGEIEVDAALRFLEEQNRTRPENRKMTIFHLFVRAMTVVFNARTNVNRFVAGGRIWQRNGLWVTFSAKQEIVDGAKMLTVKREFPPDESLEQLTDAVLDKLTRQRGGEETTSDKEMKLALDLLPPFLIRAVMRLIKLGDHLGLLPKSMIDGDPMFTSIFIANLGSLGMDAGYHHLWEHGNCPVFATMGRVKPRWDGKQVMNVRYTYDERIEDGLYAGITLSQITEIMQNPEKLL